MDILKTVAAYLCKDAPEKGSFPVSIARDRFGKEEVFAADKNRYQTYLSENTQVYVLANVNTASASEALIGAMLDYGTITYSSIFLTEINGAARTYGKGIMQVTYQNAFTGEAVKLTTSTLRWPTSDYCIHETGITPSLPQRGAIAVAGKTVDFYDKMFSTVVQNYLS